MDKEIKTWLEEPAESWEPEKPPFCKAITDETCLPELPPEQVQGLLRRGAMMLLQGASKKGKSFGLICLAIALATGGEWLGFTCCQGKVLYINLEIRPELFQSRVCAVTKAMDADASIVQENLTIWNARGENLNIDEIKGKLSDWITAGEFDAIVIDPLYKVQAGSENDAESINRFFNSIDRIAEEYDTSIIMCHHHSKGSQEGKAAIDRSSGSGVFGRAADVIVDFTEYKLKQVDVTAGTETYLEQDATPLWVSFIAREFKSPESFGAWFKYPVLECDATGALDAKKVNQSSNGKHASKMQHMVDETIGELMGEADNISRKEIETALGFDVKTVKKYIQESLHFESETVNNNQAIIKRKKIG